MDNIAVGKILIKEVEKYPIIYDSGRSDFGNKSLKQDAWEAVCKSVITTWEECSIYEKINSKRDIQKRWQAILQPFVKSLDPSSVGKHSDKHYTYHNELQFIIPTLNRPKVIPAVVVKDDKTDKTLNGSNRKIASRPTRSYMQSLQSIRPKPVTSKSKIKRQCSPVPTDTYKSISLHDPLQDTPVKTYSLIQASPVSTEKMLPGATLNQENQSTVETIPKMYVQVFQTLPSSSDKNVTTQPYEEVLLSEDNISEDDPLQPLEEDPDRMFFLSLLPSFRKIPTEHKLTAQLEVMQAIMKYTVSSPRSTPQLASSAPQILNNIKLSSSKLKSKNSVKQELNT